MAVQVLEGQNQKRSIELRLFFIQQTHGQQSIEKITPVDKFSEKTEMVLVHKRAIERHYKREVAELQHFLLSQQIVLQIIFNNEISYNGLKGIQFFGVFVTYEVYASELTLA